jgi:hypothetical protein
VRISIFSQVKDLNTIYIGGYFRNHQLLSTMVFSLPTLAITMLSCEYKSSGECQWAEKIAGTAQEWVRSIDYSQNGIY